MIFVSILVHGVSVLWLLWATTCLFQSLHFSGWLCSWDALYKSIINQVNIANIKQVIPELFSENLIQGQGLFAQSA